MVLKEIIFIKVLLKTVSSTGNYYNSKPPETIRNHPKLSETTQNFFQTTTNYLELAIISLIPPETPQQPVIKCIWLILSSKILELYLTVFPKLLKNNEYYFNFTVIVNIFLITTTET